MEADATCAASGYGARLLGLRRAVIEDVWVGEQGEVVIAARPNWRERDRCGVCRRRCPGFDLGEGRRRWRALDLGTTFAFVEAAAPRVSCRRHGVVVCAVPWARHGSRFTCAFEDQVAWLAVNASKSAVAQLMRIAWRTVGGICQRVAVEAQQEVDLLAGLRRIGIDDMLAMSQDTNSTWAQRCSPSASRNASTAARSRPVGNNGTKSAAKPLRRQPASLRGGDRWSGG
jgi:transposase